MYICTCGNKTVKWSGKCNKCGEWGTFKKVEEMGKRAISKPSLTEERVLTNIEGFKIGSKVAEDSKIITNRMISNNTTFNAFFGGGLVQGSINLMSGEPGVGKSTFLLYIAKYFPDKKVVYISGEETVYQIDSRAKRMTTKDGDFTNVTIYHQKLLENIINIVADENPDILIIDSIQMLESNNTDGELGGLKQQKHITRKLVSVLKATHTATFMVGHITKSGDIAGSEFMEHLVDAVIKIEPATERGDSLKIMKNLKNRFSGEDIIVYELYDDCIEIVDQKRLVDLFIAETAIGTKGTALSAITLDGGHQVFLVEIQSIITAMEGNYPDRTVSKFNKDELKTLLKIIGENIDSSIYQSDVAVKIFSPLKFNGEELSLAIIISLISYARNYNLGKMVFLGKVGFNGEVKSIPRQRDTINKLKGFGIEESDIITTEKYRNIQEIMTMIAKKQSKVKKKN